MVAPRSVDGVCLVHKPQEIPLDDPHSRWMFDKPFVVTRAALATFGPLVPPALLLHLQEQARLHGGLDHLQVFENTGDGPNLWFIEDGPGGAITALLPSDY